MLKDYTKDKELHIQQVRERNRLLYEINSLMEVPMMVLGVVWLGLLITELIGESNPFTQGIAFIIWVVFIIDFMIRIILAPKKKRFLKRNILTIVSLIIPALRVFRILRIIRVLRSVRILGSFRLVRLIATINRSMRTLNNVIDRRGMKFVLLLTLIIIFSGAAGIFAFERGIEGSPINSYGEAIWWIIMLLVSFGTGYWPETPEGRVLCIALAIYGFAVFSYITASLASFFVDRDAEEDKGELAGAKQLESLRTDIASLRKEIEEKLKV